MKITQSGAEGRGDDWRPFAGRAAEALSLGRAHGERDLGGGFDWSK
jgi:hypothetical protein